MKKIVALVAVLFSVVVPVQSQAAVGEKIVIIDSYFDKSKVSGSVEFVCLASDKCVNVATPKPGIGTDHANHGTVMANIARAQNPTATLVLIQTEEVKATPIFDTSKKGVTGKVIKTLIRTDYVPTVLDGSDFVNALSWVNSNKNAVSAVSFSYNLTGNSTLKNPCALSSYGGINVKSVDMSIKSVVSSLKSAGIPVFAAAGNFNNKPLQYPACIADVVSVGSNVQTTYHQDGVDLLVSLQTKSNDGLLYSVSPWFGSVQFNTSAATVAVASNYSATKAQSGKVVVVLP